MSSTTCSCTVSPAAERTSNLYSPQWNGAALSIVSSSRNDEPVIVMAPPAPASQTTRVSEGAKPEYTILDEFFSCDVAPASSPLRWMPMRTRSPRNKAVGAAPGPVSTASPVKDRLRLDSSRPEGCASSSGGQGNSNSRSCTSSAHFTASFTESAEESRASVPAARGVSRTKQ